MFLISALLVHRDFFFKKRKKKMKTKDINDYLRKKKTRQIHNYPNECCDVTLGSKAKSCFTGMTARSPEPAVTPPFKRQREATLVDCKTGFVCSCSHAPASAVKF